MNERILSDDEIEVLRKHWASAPTIEEAAKRLGVCRETARHWARKLGLSRPSTNPWTPERTELLRTLWDRGFSASQIAYRLGGGISRNSVLGKAHRLGVVIKGQRTTAYGKSLFKLKTGRPVKSDKSGFEPPISQSVNDIARVQFSELEAHHCKYPIGDPRQSGFGFCGLERVPGSPYCMPHTRISRVATPQNSIFGRVSVPAKEAENA